MSLRTLVSMAMRFGIVCCCAALLLNAGIRATAAEGIAQSPSWIMVDTQALTLTVYSGDNQVLARFHNISIGSGGTATTTRRAGDSTTPVGTFHVAWVNPHSRFHVFFGLDYPTAAYGAKAYQLGLISKADYGSILSASLNGTVPPQDTPLGGRIGIHGIGRGNPKVQRKINWTDGCIALSNADVDRLAKWIGVGTRIVIQ